MESERGDWCKSSSVSFACVCGVRYPTERWQWVDADARPELAKRCRERGPYEGSCPSCGRAAFGLTSWLLLLPRSQQATMVLGEHLRGEYLRVLRDHIAFVHDHPEFALPFVLAPEFDFLALDEFEEDTNPGHRLPLKPVAQAKPKPKPRTTRGPDMAKLAALADQAERPSSKARDLTRPRQNEDLPELGDLTVEDLEIDEEELSADLTDDLEVEVDGMELIEPNTPAAVGSLEWLGGVATA
ncbi:MAG: hypothetical protein ACPG77_06635, partial [Nannocystaceae bacterium]